jgi:hypothetical protein
MQISDFPALLELATASAAVTARCSCSSVPLLAWQSLPTSLELEQLEEVGTLVDDPYDEPTFKEYHPNGTRYESADAPIAPRYFPANLSQVLRCRSCGRHFLRYNEAGGYFTELRMRALRPELLADAAL